MRSAYRYHGGAWKVAYADFVTAMMAFFLLLWLISTTSQETKEGIADYFTPTYGIRDQAGIGTEGGLAPSEDGVRRSNLAPPGIVEGNPQKGDVAEPNKNSMVDGDHSEDGALFERAMQEMQQSVAADPNLREFSENILVEQTPEGLKLELRDTKDKPMYKPGSYMLSEAGETILTKMAPLIKKVPNHISITGHTDGVPLRNRDYSNWELSTDRANAARRFLVEQGLPNEKIAKVVGRAAQELLFPEHPASAANRRIEIILLRGSHLKMMDGQSAVPRSLISSPMAGSAVDSYKEKQEKLRLEQQQRLQILEEPEQKMPDRSGGEDIFAPTLPPVRAQ